MSKNAIKLYRMITVGDISDNVVLTMFGIVMKDDPSNEQVTRAMELLDKHRPQLSGKVQVQYLNVTA